MTLSKKTENELKAIAKKITRYNKKQILYEINKILNDKGFTDASLKTAFTDTKDIFSFYTKDKKFLSKIKAPDEIIDRVNERTEKNRRDRESFIIKNSDIDKIKGMKNSDDIYERAIYLLFITGRRTSEIMNGNFKKKENNLFTKDLIKRNNRDDKGCEFPVIWELPEETTQMIKKLQTEIEKKQIIQKSFSRTLNRRIKSTLGPGWKPHALRGAYALWNFRYNNPTNINRNGAIRKFLCHQTDMSSLSYVAFMLESDIISNIDETTEMNN